MQGLGALLLLTNRVIQESEPASPNTGLLQSCSIIDKSERFRLVYDTTLQLQNNTFATSLVDMWNGPPFLAMYTSSFHWQERLHLRLAATIAANATYGCFCLSHY